MKSLSALRQRRSTSSGSNGLCLRNHLAAGWTSGFFRGAIRPSANACPRSSPKYMTVHDVSYINHQGVIVSKRLCMLVNNLLVWAQNNLRSLKATHVPGKINQGADILSRNNVSSEEWTLHPLVVQRIWEYFGRARVDLFASEDNSHYPIFFTNSTDALAHEWPSLPLYAFPSRSATAGTQASQGTMAQADFNSHPLEEPTVSVRVIQGAESSPVADPLETGPPLSSERQDMASTALVLGPVFVAAQCEPFILPERVLNTMAEARAPSTRRLYALK